jgi:hypothetical protein
MEAKKVILGGSEDINRKALGIEPYKSIFKEKNYYIGIAVGIASVLLYQRFKK